MCMHVRVSLSVHVYLFAELICISTVCVLPGPLCCPVALAQCLLCVRVFVFLVRGVCYGKFTVISPAFLAVLGFLHFLFQFNQPAGCTVAEGSTRGLTPLGQCPTITCPAALVTNTLSGLNQADETHK